MTSSPERGCALARPARRLAAILLCAASGTAAAADYPSRPLRLIVPSAAGGGADFLMRSLAIELGAQLGQPVVTDNRAGGGGLIGMELLARATPDGYTLGYGSTSTLAIAPTLYGKVPYSVERDFQPLARFNASQNVLVVRSTLPVASVRELVEYARKNPGKLSYASSGSGTTVHLSAELFQQLTGTKLLHVPYKSSAQATADVLGGQVDLMFDNLSGIGPQLKTGKVRALGVTGPARSSAFPDLPTIAEAGVAKYEVTTWGGLLAPAGLPKAMVARLNAEILKACATASLKERLASIGNQCIGGTPQQFDAFIRSELARWSDVVRRSGAKAE